MRLPVVEVCDKTTQEMFPADIDILIGNMKKNLTVNCRDKAERRHGVRSSPYCVPGKPRHKNTCERACLTENKPHIKCSKCFQRQCKCDFDNNSDSILVLKKLLAEQTLIQEAVRRLQCEMNSAPSQDYGNDNKENWNSEGFTTRYTSYNDSGITTPGESDIDS